MANPAISIALATEEDATALATVMTKSFASSDAAYPLIWGKAAEGIHEALAVEGIFSPVQREGRVTYKAVDTTTGQIVGLVTWKLPTSKIEEGKAGGRSLPDLPDVNMELWKEKADGPKGSVERDVEVDKDLSLSLCFVHPDFQRKGIASLLLHWGTSKADELRAKTWCMSTPQAVKAYEKNGFKVVESVDIDLSKHGSEGIYSRFWMLRLPRE